MNEFDAVPSGRRRRLATKTLVHWAIACFLSVTGLVSALTGIYFLFLPSGGSQGGRNLNYESRCSSPGIPGSTSIPGPGWLWWSWALCT